MEEKLTRKRRSVSRHDVRRTRFLVVSDSTLGTQCRLEPVLRGVEGEHFDVFIHCGNGFREAMNDLESKKILVDLKLFVGEWCTMDGGSDNGEGCAQQGSAVCTREESNKPEGFKTSKEALSLTCHERGWSANAVDNVHLLREGNHVFDLNNGAHLRVYASPYPTWSERNDKDCPLSHTHVFDMAPNTDVVVTHGPPRGIMDLDLTKLEHLGDPMLFAAVARARPKLHCFGHVAQDWGARLVTWKDRLSGDSRDLTEQQAVDQSSSAMIASLDQLAPLPCLSKEEATGSERGEITGKRIASSSSGDGIARYSTSDSLISTRGSTIFVNAAIYGAGGRDKSSIGPNMPWVVDLELPSSSGHENCNTNPSCSRQT